MLRFQLSLRSLLRRHTRFAIRGLEVREESSPTATRSLQPQSHTSRLLRQRHSNSMDNILQDRRIWLSFLWLSCYPQYAFQVNLNWQSGRNEYIVDLLSSSLRWTCFRAFFSITTRRFSGSDKSKARIGMRSSLGTNADICNILPCTAGCTRRSSRRCFIVGWSKGKIPIHTKVEGTEGYSLLQWISSELWRTKRINKLYDMIDTLLPNLFQPSVSLCSIFYPKWRNAYLIAGRGRDKRRLCSTSPLQPLTNVELHPEREASHSSHYVINLRIICHFLVEENADSRNAPAISHQGHPQIGGFPCRTKACPGHASIEVPVRIFQDDGRSRCSCGYLLRECS